MGVDFGGWGVGSTLTCGAVRGAELLPLCGGRVRSPRAAHSGP